MESLSLKGIVIAPQHRVEDGINAVRVMLPKCWFDVRKTARGVDALKMYRSQYDDKLQALRANPIHDWASHGADAMRYLALAIDAVAIEGAQSVSSLFDGFDSPTEMPRSEITGY